MKTKVINQKKLKTKRYFLATNQKKFFSRAFDLLIVFIFVLCISFAIYFTDPNYKANGYYLTQSWRYLLISLINAVVFILYFILLPICTHGYTLGNKICKIKIYIPKEIKSKIKCYIKKESFIWMVFVLDSLIMGIFLFALKNDSKVFLNDLVKNSFNNNTLFLSFSIVFQILSSLSVIMLLFFIITTIIKNKTQSIVDKMANIYILDMTKTPL